MALMKPKHELPKDAVLLSEFEAKIYQWKIIRGWTPKSDVWSFSYGPGLLAIASGLSGLFINNHYRTKLRLLEYGRLSSYLPIVAMPTVLSAFFHQEFIASKILLQNDCPICIELRSAFLQISLSTLYPALLAPLSSFNYAMRYNTYNLPIITKEPKEVFKLWLRFTKPIKNAFLAILVTQSIMAIGVTHLEAKAFYRVQEKLMNLEKQPEDKEIM